MGTEDEGVASRTNALLGELAELWGAEGDVILHLFDVSRDQAKSLGLHLTTFDMATVEVGPDLRMGPYRTVNVSVRLP